MFSWWKKSKQQTARPEASSRRTRLALEAPPREALPYEVAVSVWSDVGCLREVNEDRGLYVRPGDPAVLTGKGVLALVADGMGGHAAGEVASSIAVDVLPRAYYAHSGEPHEALKDAFLQASRAIYQAARQDETLAGMGTTCTALVLRGYQAFSAHVGDSRLYQVRQGRLYTLSEDHSLVMEMVREGLLTPAEAHNHEDRNVITRALGLRPNVDVAAWPEPLTVQDGDWFVLCSDGLHDLVGEEEICQTLAAAEAPHEAGEHLVALARRRGGHDNITVGLLRVKAPGQTDAPPERDTREVEVPL